MHHSNKALKSNDSDDNESFTDSLEYSSVYSLDSKFSEDETNVTQTSSLPSLPIMVKRTMIKEQYGINSYGRLEERTCQIQTSKNLIGKKHDPLIRTQTKVIKSKRDFGTNTTPSLTHCNDQILKSRNNKKMPSIEGNGKIQCGNCKYVHIETNPNSDIKVTLVKENNESTVDKEENDSKNYPNSDKTFSKDDDAQQTHASQTKENLKIPKNIPNFINLNKYQIFNLMKNKSYVEIHKDRKNAERKQEKAFHIDNTDKNYDMNIEGQYPIRDDNYSKALNIGRSKSQNLEKTVWKENRQCCCNSGRYCCNGKPEYVEHTYFVAKPLAIIRDDVWIERSKYLQCLKVPSENKYSRKPPVHIENLHGLTRSKSQDENFHQLIHPKSQGELQNTHPTTIIKSKPPIQRMSDFDDCKSKLVSIGTGKDKHFVKFDNPGYFEYNPKENEAECQEKSCKKCFYKPYTIQDYKKLPKISEFGETSNLEQIKNERKRELYKLRQAYGKRVYEKNRIKYKK